MVENFVFKKEVDWSSLHVGITLPIACHQIFMTADSRALARGESKNIHILFAGKEYIATLLNIGYTSASKKTIHTLQIRYSANSDLARVLRSEFDLSNQLISVARAKRKVDSGLTVNVPEDIKEYLIVYSTNVEDTYVFEAITSSDTRTFLNFTNNWSEPYIERMFEQDYNAEVIEQTVPQKIRKLNKKIGENLKLVYDYRCQICGLMIGDEYGAHVVEAHHIDYFITSHNNDAQNIIIVCPNHHSIIHATNPIFNRSTATYCYDNGYNEKLLLNHHIYTGNSSQQIQTDS